MQRRLCRCVRLLHNVLMSVALLSASLYMAATLGVPRGPQWLKQAPLVSLLHTFLGPRTGCTWFPESRALTPTAKM